MKPLLLNILQSALPSMGKGISGTRKTVYGILGLVLLLVISIFISYVTVLVDVKIGVGIVVALFGIFVLFVCLTYPIVGYYSVIFISLFLAMPDRLIANNSFMFTGLIPEFLTYVVLLGVLTKKKYQLELKKGFWNQSITFWIIVLMGYYILELFNPNMFGKLGWFNFFRKQGSFFAFFYMTYALIDSRKALNFFVNFWIGVSFLEAIYACKQQWFGLFNFEYRWLYASKIRMDLYINWGYVRKFGLQSDPAAAGMLYAACTMFALVLALRCQSRIRRYFLYLVAILNLLASSYTGTRTSTMMVAAGILFYVVLTLYEKRTKILMVTSILTFVFIMFVPIYSNPVINRVRSTFNPGKDPSNIVREMSRNFARSYIRSHPIGGGIFTCGDLGIMYNPGHFLNQVMPDSGYFQVLMEQGFIGLIMLLAFYFVVLRTGIRYFYRTKDPELKSILAATLAYLFSIMAGQFSQMAFYFYPSVLFIYAALAFMLKMKYFGAEEDENKGVTLQKETK